MRRVLFASILALLMSGAATANGLSEALDTDLIFETGGNADWYSQTRTTYFDGDAAESGDIWDEQVSWIRTTVSGAGTLGFYWRVTSEQNYDFLEFYIDGVLQDRISGRVDWNQMIYTITDPGSHTLEWRYVKDSSTSNGNDLGRIDLVDWSGDILPPSSGSLSEALDTNLSCTTTGDAGWFAQRAVTNFDGDAAQSGDIGNGQDSLIQMTVSGAGTVGFFWKVSSEAGFDYLEFYIDGVLQDRITGSVGWHQMMYAISDSGSHTLKWRYVKDYSAHEGDDCGWVDHVTWSGSSGSSQPPSAGPLSEALDTSMKFSTGGNADWYSQIKTFYNDSDAAKSGDISDDQESWMQSMVSGTGTVSFFWKVSSEVGYDYLEFYIDGVFQERISGLVDWNQSTNIITSPGLHILEWRYVKDASVSEGDDCGWIDLFEWSGPSQSPSAGPLSEALDTNLSFTAAGDAGWFPQTAITYFDGDAAQSGSIWDGRDSLMQTTVSGAGTVSFFWRVSSEAGYDYLEFYIDGVLQDRITGSVGWHQMMYTITGSGSHTFKWRYVKDYSVSEGDDCGWVDYVTWSGSSVPSQPQSADWLSEALDTSLNFTTGGDAGWFSQTRPYYFGYDSAQSGDIADGQVSWMQTTVHGAGTLSFYWKISSERHYDDLKFFIDGVRQDRISEIMDWHQMTYTITGSGLHTLEWRYAKDHSASEGDDCAWVDQLEWSGDSGDWWVEIR
ncbi:MAG: hypothetical protein GY845_00910 [Planctomycetes bacterium]|nr:hypothetical protein [Planctomycetota bacterium]